MTAAVVAVATEAAEEEEEKEEGEVLIPFTWRAGTPVRPGAKYSPGTRDGNRRGAVLPL